MKIKLVDRILLVLILIIVLIVSLAVLLTAVRLVPQYIFSRIAEWPYTDFTNSLILGVTSILLLIIALRLLFGGKQQPETKPNYTLVKSNEHGSVFITLPAIDSMVQKHCRANSNIRECISNVCPVKDGVTIILKLSLLPDTNVPELTSLLQKELKEYIESLSGILVQEIGILIISMSGLHKNADRLTKLE